MKVKYKQQYDLDKPCVAKLWFGERYVIVKTPDIRETMNQFKELFKKGSSPGEGLEQYCLRRIRGADLDALFSECVVEIVLASDRGEELLAREQVLLNQRDKVQCLNKNAEPARPMWIYDWISDRPVPAGFFRVKGRHRACPAVVKIWVGEKFFIWKCKDIQVFPEKFNESISRNIERYDPGSKDLMNPLVAYILGTAATSGTIEVIFKARVGHPRWLSSMLTKEKNLLHRYAGTPVCLNKSVKQHKPAWILEQQ